MKKIDKYGYWLLFVIFFILAGIYECSGQTKEEVKAYVNNSTIINKEIVVRQIWKETEHLKCTECSLRYNNLFGFRLSKKSTIENPKGYLKFDTWQDSIDYLEKWQKRHPLKENETYYDFLVRIHWASDKNYIIDLKGVRY